MPAIDLVLFDLDGTLIETAPEIRDAVNDVMDHFGWPALSAGQIEGWIGHGTGQLLLQAAAYALGMETEALHQSGRMVEIGRYYDECYERRCGTRSRLYPAVRESLRALHAAGIKRAVVTNKERRYTERLLEAHALSDQFERLQCGDMTPARKPDPAGIFEVLRELDVPVDRALFVGDSSIDVATARNAGIPIWLVPYGYNLGQPILAADADRVIESLAELPREILDSVAGGPRRTAG